MFELPEIVKDIEGCKGYVGQVKRRMEVVLAT